MRYVVGVYTHVTYLYTSIQTTVSQLCAGVILAHSMAVAIVSYKLIAIRQRIHHRCQLVLRKQQSLSWADGGCNSTRISSCTPNGMLRLRDIILLVCVLCGVMV